MEGNKGQRKWGNGKKRRVMNAGCGVPERKNAFDLPMLSFRVLFHGCSPGLPIGDVAIAGMDVLDSLGWIPVFLDLSE